jgi:hypothetical protein
MKKVVLLVGLAATLGFNSAQSAVDWNWKGDVRYRYESSLKDVSNQTDYSRDRNRTRVRIGVYPWINEELSAGVQLSTGAADVIKESASRNQTYENLFTPKSIVLNEGFIDYHPTAYGIDGKVNLILGKREVANTLIRVEDLVWDSDLTFEGATLQFGKDANGKEKEGLNLIAGYYMLDENDRSSSKVPDAVLNVVQAAYNCQINDISYLIGAGYNSYRNVGNIKLANRTALSTNYSMPLDLSKSAYNIVELFGKFGGQLTEKLPWKVYGEYAFNTANNADYSNIDNSRRNAYQAGLTLGDTKEVGKWAIDANYNRIERDALFAPFTDSDRKVKSTTNIKGFEVGATYHLVQNLNIGARYFQYKNIDKSQDASDPTLNLLQLDALVKF